MNKENSIGNVNRKTYAVLKAVLEKPPGEAFNPLVLVGNPGTGKSFALMAFSKACKQRGRTVCYMTCEEMLAEMLQDLHKDGSKKYKDKYLESEVFLVDDMEILKDKESTQEEVGQIFDRVITAGVQVVITVSTSSWEKMPVLQKCFGRYPGCVYQELSLPDFYMKREVLERLNKEDTITGDVLDYVAEHTKEFRELEGTFHSLVARKKLLGENVTLESAKEILGKNEIV